MSLVCETCSKQLTDYHYDFESVIISEWLGWQCSQCGRVTCWEHRPSTIQGHPNDTCSCGEPVALLYEGPPYSSMVSAAMRDGKYGPHVRPPHGDRPVRQE
jgi:hypothetical protein